MNLTGDLGSGGTPYADWIAGYPELVGGETDPEANPLGDGVSNLLKLILGLNPTLRLEDDPNKANIPTLTTFNGNPALRYTVNPVNLGAGDNAIQHAGESSHDLSDWSGTAAVNVGGDTWVIEIPSVGTDQRYARLVGTVIEN